MLSNRIKLAKVAKLTVPSILQITEICMAELNGDVTMEHLRVDVYGMRCIRNTMTACVRAYSISTFSQVS